ncbi:MAG: hypothetical protein B6D55_04285 [Candidatus Omnitrophica bacterium 4484_70.2]|nr:MAG: hypothetical protein B6D55_04285 [Candidatus Omnitrophica bacterium 4484_70.2]
MEGTSILFIRKEDRFLYIKFLILTFLLYLPSFFFRDFFYPDEARNLYLCWSVSSLKQAFYLFYADEFYFHKPPLYFLLGYLLNKFSRDFLPLFLIIINILSSGIIISLNYYFFKKEGQKEVGLLSSVVLAMTSIFYGTSIIIRMDILFYLFVVLSIFLFWWSLKENKFILSLLAGVSGFLAVFTKGGFGFVFPLFCWIVSAVVFRRWLFLISSTITMSLCIGGWLWWGSEVFLKDYWKILLFKETLQKAINPYIHKEGFFYYFIFFLPILLPLSLFIIGYFINMIKAKENHSWQILMSFWSIGGLVILSIVKSKLVIYLLLISLPSVALGSHFILNKGVSAKIKVNMLYATGILLLMLFGIGSGVFFYIYRERILFLISILGIFIFVYLLCLMYRKKSLIYKLNILLYLWFFILQIANLTYLPRISKKNGVKTLSKKIGEIKFNFDKIYTTEKPLLVLNYLYKRRPTMYVKREDLQEKLKSNKNILITKDSINYPKVEEIFTHGKFKIFKSF